MFFHSFFIVSIFYFILLYSATPPHKDYIQVDCVLLLGTKSKGKRIEKMIGLKRLYKS